MIDWFDGLRFWGVNRNPFLQRLKVYGILNRLIDVAANTVLPVYFSMTKNNPKYRLDTTSQKKRKVVISLTSFPKRIPTLHLVIESLLRQTVKPDKIVLYLTASQVASIDILPKRLKDLQKRGLEIKFCPDEIRSHTKYFYAFQDFPEDIVITVDDDLFYKSDLVENHLRNLEQHPNCIIANWVKKIIPGKHKYSEWPDIHDTPEVSKNMLILGVGSVLYPPHSFHPDIFNIECIKNLTLTCDDVWLSAMILKQGMNVHFSGYKYNHLPIRIKNNETLISGNYVRNQHSVDAINDYYGKQGKDRPFIDIPIKNISR